MRTSPGPLSVPASGKLGPAPAMGVGLCGHSGESSSEGFCGSFCQLEGQNGFAWPLCRN